MATVSENLQALNGAKQAIKNAIENKGQDLSGVPFTEYAEKIGFIQGGVAKEVEITSSISNALELKVVLFGEETNGNMIYARLKQPKNGVIVQNQVLAFIEYDETSAGLRFRDGNIALIAINNNYDASVTIGDVYEVYDFGEIVYDN